MTSRLLNTLRETAQDFADIGLIDTQTMRHFDTSLLTPLKSFTAAEIKALRLRCHISQAIFAAYLNTSISTIQKWERGDKQPNGSSLKLLNLVDSKGLEVLA